MSAAKAKPAEPERLAVSIEMPAPMSFQIARDYLASVLVCTTETEPEVERIMNATRPARTWTIDPELSRVQNLTPLEMKDPPEPGQCGRWRESHRHYWLTGVAR